MHGFGCVLSVCDYGFGWFMALAGFRIYVKYIASGVLMICLATQIFKNKFY
jgi:hypothetical protein